MIISLVQLLCEGIKLRCGNPKFSEFFVGSGCVGVMKNKVGGGRSTEDACAIRWTMDSALTETYLRGVCVCVCCCLDAQSEIIHVDVCQRGHGRRGRP